MALVESAISFVLGNEGGFSEDSSDPGGTTNYGMSLRFLREVPVEVLKKASIFEPIDDQTIRNLTLDQATILYRVMFWETAPFLKIINQTLANYIFDMCVQHGLGDGIKITQRAVCDTQKKQDYLVVDGVLGGKTLAGINQASFLLQYALIAERAGYVRMLTAVQPSLKRFLDGWLIRCYRI